MLVKEHYGDPIIEQRKLSEGEALCMLDTQGVISVSGVDRLTWLHSLLSQNLKNLSAGESAEALLLDPQGRIEQVIKIIEDGQTTWLLVDQKNTESLLSWLQKMVFRHLHEAVNIIVLLSFQPINRSEFFIFPAV